MQYDRSSVCPTMICVKLRFFWLVHCEIIIGFVLYLCSTLWLHSKCNSCKPHCPYKYKKRKNMVCAKVHFSCNPLSITWSNTDSLRYCYNTVFSRHFYCISRGGFECLGFGYHCKKEKCLCTKAMCLRQLCTLMQSASEKFGAVMKNE